MKTLTLLPFLVAALCHPLTAQEDPAVPEIQEPSEESSAELEPWQEEFSNLPEEQRRQFFQHLGKARELFQQKRVFETLDELRKAEEIFDNSPDVKNMLGACQVEFRAFDKAMAHFERADELSPENPNILFNIGELHFVTKRWEKAEEMFERILPEMDPDDRKEFLMSRLVEFKLMLCKLKLDKIEEAEEYVDKYDLMDDSPFPYYAEAALAFHRDDKVKAEAAIARARRIFRNPAILSPWQDTMMEFGYIKSFYGGDLEQAVGQ